MLPRGKAYEEYYEEDEAWDFVLMTFDSSSLYNVVETNPGIYKASFRPICKEFGPSFEIFLVNVVKHLAVLDNSNGESDLSLMYAAHDKEWLILPAAPFDKGQYSAKLDANCLQHPIELFQFIN